MEKKNRIQSYSSFERYQELDVGAKLADLKISFYHQSLLLTALIDLLIEKGLIERDELKEIAMNIDKELQLQLEKSVDDLFAEEK